MTQAFDGWRHEAGDTLSLWRRGAPGVSVIRAPHQAGAAGAQALARPDVNRRGSMHDVEIFPTADDQLLASFYRRHWLEQGIPAGDAAPDWRAQALAFFRTARAEHALAAFTAVGRGANEDGPLGCACCHRVPRVYPAFRVSDAREVGYVWNVYVEPRARGRGIGAALVRACIAHLASLGCDRVLLHAGERARPLYERLGFEATDELALRVASRGDRDSSAAAPPRAS